MSEQKQPKKAPQLSLEEYNKVKEKRAKDRLKLQFPLGIKLFLIGPVLYLLFLVCYYLFHVRFVAEH